MIVRSVARRWLLAGLVGLASVIAAVTTPAHAKDRASMAKREARRRNVEGRLLAWPGRPVEAVSPGTHALNLERGRDALLYVPTGYRPEHPAQFVLSLHGAGGNETGGLFPLQALADEAGLILLSPASRGRTWDVILGGFGPDIDFIDRALETVFTRCAIDTTRMAVAGFSDGASYALSIGISNGDLFPHVIAFSPGFAAPGKEHGEPRFFVSHGTKDAVLPIDRTSRRVVPQLEEVGYDVLYREFDGPHTVPPEITRAAVSWFLAGSEPPATP